MFFPCIICGKEFKTKEDWDKEVREIHEKYPYLRAGVQKAMREELEYLYTPENPFRNLKLKERENEKL